MGFSRRAVNAQKQTGVESTALKSANCRERRVVGKARGPPPTRGWWGPHQTQAAMLRVWSPSPSWWRPPTASAWPHRLAWLCPLLLLFIIFI